LPHKRKAAQTPKRMAPLYVVTAILYMAETQNCAKKYDCVGIIGIGFVTGAMFLFDKKICKPYSSM
jgi:hypothetical protein